MFTKIRKLYDWMGSRVHAPHAKLILGFLFFLEAIFFLPTDPMLILYCLNSQKKSFLYATVATIGSVLGGIASYWLGMTLWRIAGEQIIQNSVVNLIITPERFAILAEQYRKYAAWAVFIAGFTPVPYKAATLTAGFCNIAFAPFVLFSFLARGLRFYMYAIIIYIFGKSIKDSLDKYFNIIIASVTILLIGIFWWYTR